MNFSDFLLKYLDVKTKDLFLLELNEKQRKNIITNKVFLKAGKNSDDLFFNNLVKEINLYNNNKNLSVFPKILDSFISEEYCGIVLEKINGSVIGNERNTFCENKLKDGDRCQIVKEIEKIKDIKLNFILDEKYSREEKLNKYLDKISKFLDANQLQFLSEKKSEICNINCDMVICHGDLIPPNIMLVDNMPKFIDWEFISIKPESYDISLFLMFSKERNALQILPQLGFSNKLNKEIKKDSIILCLKEINNWNKLVGRLDDNLVYGKINRWLNELNIIINDWDD